MLDRLDYLRALELSTPDARLHPNRLRQLARRRGQYPAEALTRFAPGQRYTFLAAYLPELTASMTDQALDRLDKLLGALLRTGERKQEHHFQVNARVLNANLTVLAIAGNAFLVARRDGLDRHVCACNRA